MHLLNRWGKGLQGIINVAPIVPQSVAPIRGSSYTTLAMYINT